MAESRIKDENYYQVSGWMVNRLGLKGTALAVYAIVYGFTQDGENEFTGSLQYLCDFLGGVSKPTIISALKYLTEKEYLIRRDEKINGVLFARYKANLTLVKNFEWGSKENSSGVVKKSNSGSKKTLTNNKVDISNPIIKGKIIDILCFLNEKAGTKYRAETQATQKLIVARLEDGFTVEDFQTVIDKKCAEWKDDDKMAKYLRPETLFGNKFEGYLNAPVVKKETKKPDGGVDLSDIF